MCTSIEISFNSVRLICPWLVYIMAKHQWKFRLWQAEILTNCDSTTPFSAGSYSLARLTTWVTVVFIQTLLLLPSFEKFPPLSWFTTMLFRISWRSQLSTWMKCWDFLCIFLIMIQSKSGFFYFRYKIRWVPLPRIEYNRKTFIKLKISNIYKPSSIY